MIRRHVLLTREHLIKKYKFYIPPFIIYMTCARFDKISFAFASQSFKNNLIIRFSIEIIPNVEKYRDTFDNTSERSIMEIFVRAHGRESFHSLFLAVYHSALQF